MRSSADGLPSVLPFILCAPSGSVTPADRRLLIRGLEERDNIEGTRLARATISLDHRINEAFEFFTRPAIDAKPMQWVRMHEADFSRNSTRQTGLEDGP